MNLEEAIEKIRKGKDGDILTTPALIGALMDCHVFDDEPRWVENVVRCLVARGEIKEIMENADAETLVKQVSGIEGLREDCIRDTIRRIRVGLKLEEPSEKDICRFIYNKGDDTDVPLLFIDNGDDCNCLGEVCLDTEMSVTDKSVVEITFKAAKWDGPVAGFKLYQGMWMPEIRWELKMVKNKIVFNFPIEQEKQVDNGLFLPHAEYTILTHNCIAAVMKNINPSLSDTVRLINNGFKSGLLGQQRATSELECDSTIKLFRFGNIYSWQGLKISHFFMKEGNMIVADMVPMLHHGEKCMYDKVRMRYFYLK